MRNVTILVGSPRPDGNTVTMAGILARHLPDAEVPIIHLSDLEFGPCIDCRGCKARKQVCILPDDMRPLYDRLEAADAIVVGTPIYWYGPTAQTKLLLDRLRPYYANRGMAGKKLALMLPAGSGPGDCDLTIDMFRRAAVALGMDYLGAACATAYDIGDVEKDAEALAELENLAQRIGRD